MRVVQECTSVAEAMNRRERAARVELRPSSRSPQQSTKKAARWAAFLCLVAGVGLLAALDYLGRLTLKGPLADYVGSAFSRVRLRAARIERFR